MEILGIGIFILVFVSMTKGVVIIKPHEAGVVFLLGRVRRKLGPGLHILIPGLERVIRVATSVVATSPKVSFRTKDNAAASVDVLLSYQVIDAAAAITEVSDYRAATDAFVSSLVSKSLSDLPHGQLREALPAKEAAMRAEIEKVAGAWELKIVSLDVKNLEVSRFR